MAEVVLFEAPGHVVTNDRYVWGTKVIPLSDIEQAATPFVEREYKFAAMLSVVGLGMLMWGGVGMKVFGVALVIAGIAHVRWSTERNLVMNVNGEYLHIKFPTTEMLYQVANAINGEKSARRTAHADGLSADLASLPRA